MSEIIAKIDAQGMRKNIPDIRTGDRVRVHQKVREGKKERIQVFEGVIIKIAGGRGINGSYTVRRIASGVGVEKSFPFHLPSIVKVEKVKSAKVRQSRIYYVRGKIGKAARRMKGEKESASVWEDVVAEEAPITEERSQAEIDAERAAENAEEKAEEIDEKEGEKSEADKLLEKTEEIAEEAKKGDTEKNDKPHSAEAPRDKQAKQPTGKDAGKPQAE